MLVLTRRLHEVVRIGKNIEVKILGIHGDIVCVGIQAPEYIPIHREEVFYRIKNKTNQSSNSFIKQNTLNTKPILQ